MSFNKAIGQHLLVTDKYLISPNLILEWSDKYLEKLMNDMEVMINNLELGNKIIFNLKNYFNETKNIANEIFQYSFNIFEKDAIMRSKFK